MQTKAKEHNNATHYLEEIKRIRNQLESQLEQMKIKAERNRNKLKFYKSEYIGFEVAKKALEVKEKEAR